MSARLLCAAGAVVMITAIPVAHPASAEGINDIVRNLNNTMNPNDAQRREDQARREDQIHREDRAHRWREAVGMASGSVNRRRSRRSPFTSETICFAQYHSGRNGCVQPV